jgi:MFS transporter
LGRHECGRDQRIVSPWFMRERPAALSFAYNGGSIGGVVFSPLWVTAIGALGFPAAAATIGAVAVVTLWCLADLLFARTPEEMGLTPDGDAGASAAPDASPAPPCARSLWLDQTFLTLCAGMTFGLFAQIGLIAHLFSLLAPALGAQAAGWAMGGATALAIGGRTAVGWLMPAGANRRFVACASYALQIAGSLAFIVAAARTQRCFWPACCCLEPASATRPHCRRSSRKRNSPRTTCHAWSR